MPDRTMSPLFPAVGRTAISSLPSVAIGRISLTGIFDLLISRIDLVHFLCSLFVARVQIRMILFGHAHRYHRSKQRFFPRV